MLLQQTILLLNAKDVILPIFHLISKKFKIKFKKLKTSFFKNFYYKMPENNHLHMLFQV